jgi:hypothetical protein
MPPLKRVLVVKYSQTGQSSVANLAEHLDAWLARRA